MDKGLKSFVRLIRVYRFLARWFMSYRKIARKAASVIRVLLTFASLSWLIYLKTAWVVMLGQWLFARSIPTLVRSKRRYRHLNSLRGLRWSNKRRSWMRKATAQTTGSASIQNFWIRRLIKALKKIQVRRSRLGRHHHGSKCWLASFWKGSLAGWSIRWT